MRASGPLHCAVGQRPPCTIRRSPLVNNPIGALQDRWRDRQSDRLRGPEIDDQLELGGLLDREVAGFGALEDFIHVSSEATLQVCNVWPIDHKTAGLDVLRRSGRE